MKSIELTEADKLTIARCLTEGTEPPQELAKKLFPSFYADWDFKTLKDAKIPTIEYQGKRPAAAILNEASVMGAACPLQLERCFDGGKINKKATQLLLLKEYAAEYDANWRNLIVWGDNLQFLKTCYLNQDPLIKDRVKGKVKLIYIDPPFATQSEFEGASGENSYVDKVDRAEFIEGMRERLLFLYELISDDGSIFVHLDYKMSHYIKIILDEVFGRQNFRNEIAAKRKTKNLQNQFEEVRQLNISMDSILWYSKNPQRRFKVPTKENLQEQNLDHWNNFFNGADRPTLRYPLLGIKLTHGQWRWEKNKALEAVENYRDYLQKFSSKMSLYKYWIITGQTKRFIKREPGATRCYYWVPPKDQIIVDTNWTDIYAYDNSPGSYPTQKSELLIERILELGSRPGDLVMDAFAGSGTTSAAAEKLGRRWIMCDFGKHAVYTMQKRMCLIADSQKLGTKTKQMEDYAEPPKPFAVVSIGAFDFRKIMNLRENRDAYVSFVIGMFGITGRDDKLSQKYKVSNVCALKDGNPVEVYPIWNDEYLKHVRVDIDYLHGILEQSGGKLKGDYYIIAPESCVRIGSETEMKNAGGGKVTFHMLTFPYKVLEEIARNFSIEEQPDSSANINKLISSVGFYFNEEVTIEVKKTKKGFAITRFTTSILDKQEKRYKGLEGLAMVLVDSDYDPERGFTVDTVVYQKDITDGEVTAEGINGKTAVIAIDKYGNESEITKIGK